MVPRTAIVTVAIILAVITTQRQATAYPQQLQRTRHHHPSLQLHATAVPYPDQVASISAAWDDLVTTNQPQRVAAAHPHVDAALRSFDTYDASTDTGDVLFPAQPDDAAVLDVTRRWVQAVIADFAVCPFTVQVCAPLFSLVVVPPSTFFNCYGPGGACGHPPRRRPLRRLPGHHPRRRLRRYRGQATPLLHHTC